ncbi:hypothetical protein ACWEQL_26965 [Kitasatospora sp. NPDC004240]
MASERSGPAEDAGAGVTPGTGVERHLVRWLVREMTSDPGHLPENLASFSFRFLSPGAAAVVARVRREHPDAGPEELRTVLLDHNRRIVVSQGAFVGGPFMALIPVAFCGALLAQLRMTLELAELAGHDATDPRRAAELLVLQGAHPDVPTATAALAALDDRPVRHGGLRPRRRLSALWAVIVRMAHLLGLVGPPEAPDPLPVRIRRWAGVIVLIVVGFVVPLVWLPYLAVSYHHATGKLARRTVGYYRDGPGPDGALPVEEPEADGEPGSPGGVQEGGPGGPRPAGEPEPDRPAADPGIVAAFLRAAVSVLVPVGTVLFFLVGLKGWDEGAGWPRLALLLTAAGAAVGTLWYLRHRRR